MDDKPFHPGPTDFRFLAILMEHSGRVWSLKSLFDYVCGETGDIEKRTVDVHTC
ncbi:MAG: winged helix-turn-helix domain-containing protein [Loktanella sp.]|nr:winged helix-turn-helix domain-containing protein [Loktanella sp.]